MTNATLFVNRYPSEDERQDGPNWGNYRFLGLPTPGDEVRVTSAHFIEVLIVTKVEHAPVRDPLPASDSPFRRTEPSVAVHTKWVDSI